MKKKKIIKILKSIANGFLFVPSIIALTVVVTRVFLGNDIVSHKKQLG